MALEKAIAVIQETRNHTLGVLVLDFVNEEREGSARDELRFRLNIAMGQYADAARDAMELARFEQVGRAVGNVVGAEVTGTVELVGQIRYDLEQRVARLELLPPPLPPPFPPGTSPLLSLCGRLSDLQ